MEVPTREELAKLAIDVMDAQQGYFRSKSPELLRKCRSMESQLRDMAVSCLAGGDRPAPQPTLFDMIDNSDL